MEKGTYIHYVQEQDQYGHWDARGEAFLDEDKCRAFVIDLDITWIMENVSGDDFRESLIPHVPQDALEQMSFDEIEAEVRKVADTDTGKIYAIMENEDVGGQCGGFYSWETLKLEDGTEEEDGMAVHTRANAS